MNISFVIIIPIKLRWDTVFCIPGLPRRISVANDCCWVNRHCHALLIVKQVFVTNFEGDLAILGKYTLEFPSWLAIFTRLWRFTFTNAKIAMCQGYPQQHYLKFKNTPAGWLSNCTSIHSNTRHFCTTIFFWKSEEGFYELIRNYFQVLVLV